MRNESSGSQQSSGPSPTANSPAVFVINSPGSSLLASTVASNSPDELTLTTLGLKIGDKVVVDASSTKTKVI